MKKYLLPGSIVILLLLCIWLIVFQAIPAFTTLLEQTPMQQAKAHRQRNAMPFDKEVWRTATSTDEHGSQELSREYMIDDLLARYDFIGWHRNEVEELLGPPDIVIKEHSITEYILSRLINYIYFRFDENDSVIEYDVVWENY
jgi:hypothetical protein